jgi:pimeloyl-ACP methyl ester carboxylesterase
MEREAYVDVRSRPSLRQRALWVAMVVLVLLPSGFAYEQFGEWRDRKLAPQVGRSVDIGGRSLNIYCSGEGNPTVILESNWGAPGYGWLPIQREIAKFTRVCWYDRAGYGWSDPGPYPNHSDSIARDLHQLLTAAHISPPYVLAAHAMGAFHARVYRGFYPSEVVGLVLIDPMNEDMTIHIHNHIEAFRPAVLLMRRTFGNLGLARLMYSDPGQAQRGYTQQEWNTLVTLKRQLKSRVASGMEPPLWICGELARASGSFGDIPVVVLSAGIQDQEEDPKLDSDQPLKLELQHKLAGLSTQGKQVIVEKSGHDIPAAAPEAVVRAVRDTVSEVRRTLLEPDER